MQPVEILAIAAIAAAVAYAVLKMGTADRVKRLRSEAGAPARPAARKQPWAVGDVGLFDGEDPNYCGRCKQWCDSPFFEGHSTQCDQCQATCPGVRND